MQRGKGDMRRHTEDVNKEEDEAVEHYCSFL